MRSIIIRCRSLLVAGWRVLLGAFVLWQVVYLFASLLFNVEEAFQSLVHVGWLRAWNECEVNGIRQYGQATAQRQRWQLFAPEAWKEIRFIEMELCWPDAEGESVMLRATCEPDDLNAFAHLGGYRLRKYEDSITPGPPTWPALFGEESDLEDNEVFAEVVYRDSAAKILAYMRWRLAAFRRAHPDRPPPSKVQLWLHVYHIPEPPGPALWHWEDHGYEYIGRWLP